MKKKFKYLLLVNLFFLLIACNEEEKKNDRELKNHFAKGFQIFESSDGVYAKLSNGEIIKENGDLQKLSVWTTTYIPYLEALAELRKVHSIKGAQWVSNSFLIEKLEQNEIVQIPENEDLDIEKLLINSPDVVLTYQFSPRDSSHYKMLKNYGIKVLNLNPFEEKTPLGRVEWIKVFGILLGKKQRADSIYTSIEKKYLAQKKNEKNAQIVLMGAPYKGTWWSPGGSSSIVSLIEDSGAEYIWQGDSSIMGISKDLEEILKEGQKATRWINTLPYASIQEMISDEPRLKFLNVFKTGEMYSPIKKKKTNGANDYYETGVFRPDLVLKEINSIIQGNFNTDSSVWFEKLK